MPCCHHRQPRSQAYPKSSSPRLLPSAVQAMLPERDIWKRLSADVADVYGSKSAVALAENLLESGNPEAARTVADNFINANPPHAYWLARGFIVLSDALRAQGDTFEADEYLRTLKSNYPGTEADIFEMIEKRLTK